MSDLSETECENQEKTSFFTHKKDEKQPPNIKSEHRRAKKRVKFFDPNKN